MPRMMWSVGVEGDRYDQHKEGPECGPAGCVPVNQPDPESEADYFRDGMREVAQRTGPGSPVNLKSEAWIVYCMVRAALKSMGISGPEPG